MNILLIEKIILVIKYCLCTRLKPRYMYLYILFREEWTSRFFPALFVEDAAFPPSYGFSILVKYQMAVATCAHV